MTLQSNPFSSLRWKRNRRLVAILTVAAAILILGFGSARVTAITSSERHAEPDETSIDIQGFEDIFDDSEVHEVAITFDQADYDRMVETFQAEGSKEYIEAEITIDGTTISSVGLRLKGNSTLRGLSDSTSTLTQPPDQNPDTSTPADPNQSQTMPAPDTGMGQPAGGLSSDLSFDDPTSLPWLISFDEYVEGQRYQGYEEIAIRPMTGSTTMLNEALGLALVGMAGEPTQQASYTSFSINGADASLRLLVEVPEAAYVDANFEHDGVLYKALSTGTFVYLGEDPLAYEDAFDQITRKNQQDLAPLIDLLQWVEESSDEEFAAELAEHVDVASLARYIAIQELLNNFDDMSGPGQNYYLWYDLETEQFSVLTWDLNLAFGQGMGGGFGGQAPGNRPDGDQFQPGQMPQGQPPAGQPDTNQQGEQPQPGQFPGGTNPQNGQPPAGQQNPAGGGGGLGGNLLKERFLANAAFDEIYADAYAEVSAALYGDGQASAELERLSDVLATSGLVDATVLESEVAALQTAIDTLGTTAPTPDTTTP